jgi:hypothetical protein
LRRRLDVLDIAVDQDSIDPRTVHRISPIQPGLDIPMQQFSGR